MATRRPTSPEGIAYVDAIVRRVAARDRDQEPTATATGIGAANGCDPHAGSDPVPVPVPGPEPEPEPAGAPDPEPEGDRRPGRPSQATELVGLARARYDVCISATGEPFAVAKPGAGPYTARMLRGGRASLRAELAARYATTHRRAASSALADALLVLEGWPASNHPSRSGCGSPEPRRRPGARPRWPHRRRGGHRPRTLATG